MSSDAVDQEKRPCVDFAAVWFGIPISAIVFAVPGWLVWLVHPFEAPIPDFLAFLLLASAFSPYFSIFGVPVGWVIGTIAARRRWISSWACAVQGAVSGAAVALGRSIYSATDSEFVEFREAIQESTPILVFFAVGGSVIGLIYWVWLRITQPHAFADPQ